MTILLILQGQECSSFLACWLRLLVCNFESNWSLADQKPENLDWVFLSSEPWSIDPQWAVESERRAWELGSWWGFKRACNNVDGRGWEQWTLGEICWSEEFWVGFESDERSIEKNLAWRSFGDWLSTSGRDNELSLLLCKGFISALFSSVRDPLSLSKANWSLVFWPSSSLPLNSIPHQSILPGCLHFRCFQSCTWGEWIKPKNDLKDWLGSVKKRPRRLQAWRVVLNCKRFAGVCCSFWRRVLLFTSQSIPLRRVDFQPMRAFR